jgi:hypothetical protein
MPTDYRANFALAEVLRDRRKDSQARARFARAERLKDLSERLAEITTRHMSDRPHDLALHSELGALLIQMGHAELGKRWLLGALQKDPDCRAAHAALADYYQSKGDAEKAAEHRRLAGAAPKGDTGP